MVTKGSTKNESPKNLPESEEGQTKVQEARPARSTAVKPTKPKDKTGIMYMYCKFELMKGGES